MATDLPAVRAAWSSLIATEPPPGTPVVLASAAAALALVAVPALWPRARHLLTVVHEAGHGVAAVVTGRRLAGIRLHSDTSGLTVSRGRPRGPGMVLTLLAGYPAPALLGLAAAAVLAGGRPLAVLAGLLVLLAAVLLQIRNLFGLWVLLVCGGATVAVAWWAPHEVRAVVAHVVTWFLLLGAPRAVAELASSRRRDRARTSDADQLARVTRVPAPLWVLAFALVTGGALVLGAASLVPGWADAVAAAAGRSR